MLGLMFRRLDWLLLIFAVLAIAVGVYVNPPVCTPVLGATTSLECVQWRFPIESAAGVTVALICLAVIAVRIRRPLN